MHLCGQQPLGFLGAGLSHQSPLLQGGGDGREQIPWTGLRGQAEPVGLWALL